MYQSLPRPTIFAHRGASAHAPENTLAAFQLAAQLKAPAIELDAKLTADGEIVVIHDQTIDRTTGGTGIIRKLPLAALRELDAGSKFDPKYKGEKIPTLSEVFEAVGHKLFINIEITNYANPLDNLPIKIANLVKQHNLQDWVLYSSFIGLNLRRAHRITPQVPLGLLTLPGYKNNLIRSLIGKFTSYQALHPEVGDVTPQLIESTHQQGKRVHAYTVNDPDMMSQMFSWGIDGIFTDDPALALKLISNNAISQS
jgi:glycerophosphoryl diester phosphodiesterase